MNMEETIRQLIRDEIRLLFENVTFDNNKTYPVPDNVAKVCQKALDEVEKNNLTSSGTSRGSGKKKAKELAEKKTQTHSQLQNLKSFFETNEQDYTQAKIKGLTISNSGVMQSWELHGANDCRHWVNQKLKMTKDSNLSTKKNMRTVGSSGVNKGMGIFAGTDMISTTNHRTHR